MFLMSTDSLFFLPYVLPMLSTLAVIGYLMLINMILNKNPINRIMEWIFSIKCVTFL